MKVVHVISGLKGGGAEHMLLALCQHSINCKDTAMQVVCLSAIADLAERFEGISVFIPDITRSNTRNRVGLRTALAAIRYLLKLDPPLLHAHMFYGCMAACIVKLLRPRTRIVFTLHNTYQPNFFYRLFLYLTRPMRFTDIIFPGVRPNWYQKSNAIAIANAPYHSQKEESSGVSEVFTCLFAGRLDKQKRPLLLPHIAEKLAGKKLFRIIVAGSGPLEHTLRHEIARRQLESYFECVGFTNNIAQLLARAHCLLLPSAYEGMPLIVMEAAAARVPVIATPEAMKVFNIRADEAFLASPQNFYQAIEKIMSDPASAYRVASNLQNKLAAYTIENCYREHIKLYASAVQ